MLFKTTGTDQAKNKRNTSTAFPSVTMVALSLFPKRRIRYSQKGRGCSNPVSPSLVYRGVRLVVFERKNTQSATGLAPVNCDIIRLIGP